MDQICIDDPRKFWEHIKRLGPKRVSSLPEMVKTEDGISSDPDEVINKWQNTFEGLYNPQNINYDKTFYDAALADIARYENDPILSMTKLSLLSENLLNVPVLILYFISYFQLFFKQVMCRQLG